MGLRIASFNIQKFSKNSVYSANGGETRKDLDKIADIIRKEKFDIVAIQEIFHQEALKELLEKLSFQYAQKCKGDQLKRGNYLIETFSGISDRMNASFGYRTKHWEGRWAQPKSYYGGNNIQEGYAFIWNRDRVKLVTNMKGDSFEPRISDYHKSNKLARPPFIGRFMPINGRYEIRLINTHVVFAEPSKKLKGDADEEKEHTDQNDYRLRIEELKILLKSIYYKFSLAKFDHTGHDKKARNLVPYTFLLGDYNLNIEGAGQSSAIIPSDLMCFELKRDMIVKTFNERLTTLKGKSKNEEKQRKQDRNLIENHLANNYDHFSFDINRLKKHQIKMPEVFTVMGFNYYVDNNEGTKYDQYRNKVSDHIPIYIDFDVRKVDRGEG